MELITVRELFKNTEKYVDQEIEIGGWVRNKRPSKQFGFIVLNDGTAEDAALYYTIVKEILGDEWLTTELFRIGASSAANNILSAIEGKDICYF